MSRRRRSLDANRHSVTPPNQQASGFAGMVRQEHELVTPSPLELACAMLEARLIASVTSARRMGWLEPTAPTSTGDRRSPVSSELPQLPLSVQTKTPK
jgi:hypothetical protein